jgi:hypothetical protein
VQDKARKEDAARSPSSTIAAAHRITILLVFTIAVILSVSRYMSEGFLDPETWEQVSRIGSNSIWIQHPRRGT